MATVPPALCTALSKSKRAGEFGALSKACDNTSAVRIYGDTVMFNKANEPHEADATVQLAVFATMQSFDTFFAAAAAAEKMSPSDVDPSARALGSCVNDPAPTHDSDRAWTWPDDPFYKCVFRWWEVMGRDEGARIGAIDAAWSRGDMDGLMVLPSPAYAYPSEVGVLGNVDVRVYPGGCAACTVSRTGGHAWGSVAALLTPVLLVLRRGARRARRRQTLGGTPQRGAG